jgi:membrane protease YdiL (CAAX protease family)
MTDPSSFDPADEPASGPGAGQTILERFGISPTVFAVLTLVALFLFFQVVGGGISLLLFGLTPGPEHIPGLRLANALGQILFLFVPTLLLVRLATRSPRLYFRMHAPKALQVLLALLGILSLQQVLQVYLEFQSRIPLPGALERALNEYRALVEELLKGLVSADSVPELLWVIVVIALVPAVVEEFLFRGLVQSSLEADSTPLKGAIVTGVIFGAFHLNPSSFVPLALLGVFLGVLAYRSNSLWVPIAAHFMNNATACVASYFHVDDSAVVTGDPKAMSPAMLLGTLWLFGLLFLLVMVAFLRVTAPGPDDGDGEGEAEEA